MGYGRRDAITNLIVAFYIYISYSSMCHCIQRKKNKKLVTGS